MKLLKLVHKIGTFLGVILFLIITISFFIKALYIVAPLSMILSLFILNKYGKYFSGIGIFTHFILSFIPVFTIFRMSIYVGMPDIWQIIITTIASIAVGYSGYYIETCQEKFSKHDFVADIIGAIYPLLMILSGNLS